MDQCHSPERKISHKKYLRAASNHKSGEYAVQHTPLTPPLTPASSSNDNIDSSNPSEPTSPAASRWSHNNSLNSPRYPVRMTQEHQMKIADGEIASSVDVPASNGLNLVLSCDPPSEADTITRFLLVGGIPKDAPSNTLRNAFKAVTAFKGVDSRYQNKHGAVILSFYDYRHASQARQLLESQTFFNGSWLNSRYLPISELRQLSGHSPLLADMDGEISVTVDGGTIDNASLRNVLASFGELRAFSQATTQHRKAYTAEYFDVRAASCALNSLNNRSLLGCRLQVSLGQPTTPIPFPQSHDQSPHASVRTIPGDNQNQNQTSPHCPLLTREDSREANNNKNTSYANASTTTTTYDTTNSSPFHSQRPLPHSPSPNYSNRRISTGSYKLSSPSPTLHQSTSEKDLRRKAAAQEAAEPHIRRTSNVYGFDAVRKAQQQNQSQVSSHRPLTRSRAISESSASPILLPSRPPPHSRDSTTEYTHVNNADNQPQPQSQPQSQRHEYVPPSVLTPLQLHAPFQNECNMPPPLPPFDMHPHCGSGVFPPTSMFWANEIPQLMSPSIPPAPPMLPPPSHFMPMSPTSHHDVHNLPFSPAPPFSPIQTLPLPPPGPIPMRRASLAGPTPLPPMHTNNALPMPPAFGAQLNHTHVHLPSSARGAADIVREPPPERNQIDLQRIAEGMDTRTTVMIKNIPNKLSDRDLIEFIAKVCPRKIDFLYLRMDFQNGCNVGYAFVNFIHVQDLLQFARAKLGVKWNMFSSEKVLQMSYANYQGKEALVEKFKNSCVMDERESWRPKIFFSSGPRQGLPEPFPQPTHLRRKERSSQNRGALFVPGSGPHPQQQPGSTTSGNSGVVHLRRPNLHQPHLARVENRH